MSANTHTQLYILYGRLLNMRRPIKLAHAVTHLKLLSCVIHRAPKLHTFHVVKKSINSHNNYNYVPHYFCGEYFPVKPNFRRSFEKKHSCCTAIRFKIHSGCSLNYCTDDKTGTKITPAQ